MNVRKVIYPVGTIIAVGFFCIYLVSCRSQSLVGMVVFTRVPVDNFNIHEEEITHKFPGAQIMAVNPDIHDRSELISFHANKEAGKKAFEMSNLTPSDIQVAEIYDNYSITELITLEDLGFFKPGEAGIASLDGKTSITSEGLVTSPSGGLKAMGHPIGATGVGQTAEIFWQLRSEVQKERQVKNATYGLTHSLGGIGSSASVNIFSQ